MRATIGSVILAAGALLLTEPAPAALSGTLEVGRTVTMLFAGGPGQAGGDVNADGNAAAADVVGTVIGLRSPTQAGPYGVGVRQITLTKRSVTRPEEDRVLRTHVWYPASPGRPPTAIHPGGQTNAPLAEDTQGLPLVIFSHGSCGYQEQSVFFTLFLASYGFIVAAPPHPGNTTNELFTCGRPENTADSYENRPFDIRFVLDSLLEMNEDPDAFLHGAIDPARIGMSGHSFGGLTTFRVTFADPRIVAGLAMAPVARGIEDEVAAITVPMMIQVGDLDGLLSQGVLAYDLLGPPRYLLTVDRMTHAGFVDLCIDCTRNSLTAEQAQLYVMRYAIPFLLRWVAGDNRFDGFLDPTLPPPGAVYSADVGEG